MLCEAGSQPTPKTKEEKGVNFIFFVVIVYSLNPHNCCNGLILPILDPVFCQCIIRRLKKHIQRDSLQPTSAYGQQRGRLLQGAGFNIPKVCLTPNHPVEKPSLL